MIFAKTRFVHIIEDIDDFIEETRYKTVDEILSFFAKMETPAKIELSSLGYLMKAKDDKSINFILTKSMGDLFEVHELEKPFAEDEELVYPSNTRFSGSDIICMRYKGKERVLRDIIQHDEYFEEEKNGVKGYLVYKGDGVTTRESDFVYNTRKLLKRV
jgi:hypothetical protein